MGETGEKYKQGEAVTVDKGEGEIQARQMNLDWNLQG